MHGTEHLRFPLYIISYLSVTPTFAANDCLPFIRLCVFSLSLPSQPCVSSTITIHTDFSRAVLRTRLQCWIRKQLVRCKGETWQARRRGREVKEGSGERVGGGGSLSPGSSFGVTVQHAIMMFLNGEHVSWHGSLSRYWLLLWLQH